MLRPPDRVPLRPGPPGAGARDEAGRRRRYERLMVDNYAALRGYVVRRVDQPARFRSTDDGDGSLRGKPARDYGPVTFDGTDPVGTRSTIRTGPVTRPGKSGNAGGAIGMYPAGSAIAGRGARSLRRRTRTGPDDAEVPAGRRRFEELVAENYAALIGYARRRTDQPADAADVVCDVFLVAWRRIDDVPPGVEGRLWLYGVARRTLAGHRRGAVRRDVLDERLLLEAEIGRVESADPFFAEPVNRALRRLSDHDRELLTLTAWEELSPTEIATILDLQPGTVRVQLHRARRRLERFLDTEDLPKRWTDPRHGRDGRATARPGGEEAP